MATFLDSLKGMFSGAHKGVTIGVDVGSSSIKIVEIEKVEERAVLRNYGEIFLGPRAGVSVGQATNLPPEKIAEAIRDLLREAGITARHTMMAIPFSASLLSVVELPDVGEKELANMVPIEARRYIPVPVSEVMLDWWVLPKLKSAETPQVAGGAETPIAKVEVIIAAIHNEVIKKYETIERNAQLPGETSHFEIEIFSTMRAVVGRDLSAVLVIDIGAGSTKIAIVDGGVVRGSHIISAGGQDITLALSRSQNIPIPEAEDMKCRIGMLGEYEGRDVGAVADLILANMMSESVRFVESYEQKHHAKIEKVIVVGGGALLKGIDKVIAKSFPKLPVTIGDPFARVDSPAVLAKTIKELSPRFSVAVGVALKGLEE